MRLRGMAATAVGALALGVPAAAMGGTLIGQFGQDDKQGANSVQSAVNGTGGAEFAAPGVKFISGDSKPKTVQQSTNTEDNTGHIGGAGTVIGDGLQANKQAIDSGQAAKKGTQISLNKESGTQLIEPNAGDTIIGSTAQDSKQGVNSLQSAAGGPGGGTTFIGGPINKGPLTENSANIVTSCQVVIGNGSCTPTLIIVPIPMIRGG